MHNSSYTLITGAGQGFGKALAMECARRQMNLVLVALPGEGLAGLAQAIRQQFGVDAIAIETDLCAGENCRSLYNQVAALKLPVNMLINNAGIGCTAIFGEKELPYYERQIRLNVLATTTLTYLFLPLLQQNNPAYILNVGSLASFFSLQKKQVYGGTKSFVLYFSKSLRREVAHRGVSVSVVCPGGMYTNSDAAGTLATGDLISRASGMHPADVAPIALNGLLQKKEVIIPGRINWWLVFLNRFVPRFVVRFFEERTMKRLHTPKPPCLPMGEPANTQPLPAGTTVYDITLLQTEPVRLHR